MAAIPQYTPGCTRGGRKSLQICAKSDQGIDPERREPQYLVVFLVGDVLDPDGRFQTVQPPELSHEQIGPADIDAVVAGIAAGELGLELARHDVGLHEERQAVPRRHRHPDIARVPWHAWDLLIRVEILGV